MPESPEPGSARYFALLYSPEPQRTLLGTLFAIEREVYESVRPGLDHQVAHSRLQWWREECERAAARRAVHPLTKTLTGVLKDSSTSLGGLTGFVDVAVWDLAGATFETRRELDAYCERWAAAMIAPLVADAAPLGRAMREIEMLTHLVHEAHYGRLRLPLDELDRLQVEPGVLARPPFPESVAGLLRARHQSLRGEIGSLLSETARKQRLFPRGLIVWAALLCRLSERAERALPDRAHPARFDGVTDTWFAWRAARRAALGVNSK